MYYTGNTILKCWANFITVDQDVYPVCTFKCHSWIKVCAFRQWHFKCHI